MPGNRESLPATVAPPAPIGRLNNRPGGERDSRRRGYLPGENQETCFSTCSARQLWTPNHWAERELCTK